MGKIQDIFLITLKKLQHIDYTLEVYSNIPILHKTMEKIIKKLSHDIEIETGFVFELMPKGYFDSLKFLRYHWYTIETDLSIL